jgi:hypothetical protein
MSAATVSNVSKLVVEERDRTENDENCKVTLDMLNNVEVPAFESAIDETKAKSEDVPSPADDAAVKRTTKADPVKAVVLFELVRYSLFHRFVGL